MANPILARELKAYTRSLRAYGLRTAFVAVLAIVVIAAWSAALRDEQLAAGGIVDVRNLPHLGRQLFSAFTRALGLLIVLIVPAYAGGGICVERERGTLEMTLATQVKARGMVWGKFAAAMVLAIALLLASLPVMGAAFLLGGVSLPEVAWMVVMLIATAAAAAGLSLYWSSVVTRTYWAIIATLITVAAAHFILPPLIHKLCYWFADMKLWGLVSGWHMAADMAWRCSPFNALQELLAGSAMSERWLGMAGEGWKAALGHWALAQGEAPAFLLGLAVLALKRTSARIARTDMEHGAEWTRRLWIRALAIVEGRPRLPTPGGRLSRLVDRVTNPVLTKDLRGRSLGQPRWAVPAVYLGLLVVAALATVAPGWAVDPDLAAKLLCGAGLTAGLFAAAAAAASIALEKEHGTLPLIVATPLNANAIVSGKLWASVLRVQPWLLLFAPIGLLAGVLHTLPWSSVLWVWVLVEALCLASACLGMLASVLLRRTSHAVLVALVAWAFLVTAPVWIRSLGLMGVVGRLVPGRWPPWMAQNLFDVTSFMAPSAELTGMAAPLLVGLLVVGAGVAFLVALAAFRVMLRRGVEAAPRRRDVSEEPATEAAPAAAG